jgi:hypothetical protein
LLLLHFLLTVLITAILYTTGETPTGCSNRGSPISLQGVDAAPHSPNTGFRGRPAQAS